MTQLKSANSTRIRASMMRFTAVTCLLLPIPGGAQNAVPWEELQRDVDAKLDRSLESIAGFAQLDAHFHAHSAKSQPSSPSAGQRSEVILSYKSGPQPVDQFVQFFSGPARSFYQASAGRLGRYRPMIDEVFGREGVPPDLIWIGLVESGYDTMARSPRNAVGIWQLTPETAARYGLSVGERMDERTDAVKSTMAAARFLRHLYNVFQDWNLVLAAYNSGEDRVFEAVAQGGTKDFWQLAGQHLRSKETRDYVPAVLAAMQLERTSAAKR